MQTFDLVRSTLEDGSVVFGPEIADSVSSLHGNQTGFGHADHFRFELPLNDCNLQATIWDNIGTSLKRGECDPFAMDSNSGLTDPEAEMFVFDTTVFTAQK